MDEHCFLIGWRNGQWLVGWKTSGPVTDRFNTTIAWGQKGLLWRHKTCLANNIFPENMIIKLISVVLLSLLPIKAEFFIKSCSWLVLSGWIRSAWGLQNRHRSLQFAASQQTTARNGCKVVMPGPGPGFPMNHTEASCDWISPENLTDWTKPEDPVTAMMNQLQLKKNVKISLPNSWQQNKMSIVT